MYSYSASVKFLKVVYMDEPSTGLDPASRNSLWNVVKRAKQDRAIILTSTLILSYGFWSKDPSCCINFLYPLSSYCLWFWIINCLLIWFHNSIDVYCLLNLSTNWLINLVFKHFSAHSMEEAEVLCDRLGIFVDGSLQCIGNPKEVTLHCTALMICLSIQIQSIWKIRKKLL